MAGGHIFFEVTGTPIRGQRPTYFIVPKGHKILKITNDYVIYEQTLYAALCEFNIAEASGHKNLKNTATII